MLKPNLTLLIESINPDVIFYQCGVDVLASDKLGRLSLTLEGCKERDRLVLREASGHGIPLVATMGGGYSDSIRTIIEAHANTFRLAQELCF